MLCFIAVDLKTGAGSIYRGSPKSGKADVTISMDDEDVILMMLGKLNPQKVSNTFKPSQIHCFSI